MPFEENGLRHSVVMEGRKKLSVSGVEEVESFDDTTIRMTTVLGELEVQGEGLHIEKLSLDGGDRKVEGQVSALFSQTEGPVRGGLLSRLLGG